MASKFLFSLLYLSAFMFCISLARRSITCYTASCDTTDRGTEDCSGIPSLHDMKKEYCDGSLYAHQNRYPKCLKSVTYQGMGLNNPEKITSVYRRCSYTRSTKSHWCTSQNQGSDYRYEECFCEGSDCNV